VARLTTEQEAAIRAGKEAKMILENELVSGALKAMEELSFHEFRRSKFEERDVRERAYLRLSAAMEFRTLLTSYLTTGRLVEEEVSRADAAAKAAALPTTDADSPNERRHL
jgi:hypothetical protein